MNTTLDPDPTWTALDQEYPNLVTSYSIERGRAYELDRTDTGRATVSIADRDGILDPTNLAGPYAGAIGPLIQAALGRYNPIDETWYCRYRGFVEDIDYVFDPSQKVNRLVLTLVDLFEIITSIEMHPGEFGVTPPAGVEGQVFFEDTASGGNGMQVRALQVLVDAGIDEIFYVVFSGNVELHETTYSAGESAMTALAEAIDAEFPGVANAYCDRLGRLAVHGRYSRFDPVATAATVTPDRWDYHEWNVGDGARVTAHASNTAHVRRFAFNYGLAKILNRALASPIGIVDADVAAQLVQDTSSIGKFGIRTWTSQNLITKSGTTDATDDLEETRLYAQWIIDNFTLPQKRVTDCALRSINPADASAAANWSMLSKCDIGDTVRVYVDAPGGGGFAGEGFFIEGIREEVRPLNAQYDDVTLSLDLSPSAYFAASPFPPL